VASIKEETRDGRELVVFMLRVLRGQTKDGKLRDRIEAATCLADRGFGKPTQGVELAGKDGEALLSREAHPPRVSGPADSMSAPHA
jgi:hypothetical protein